MAHSIIRYRVCTGTGFHEFDADDFMVKLDGVHFVRRVNGIMVKVAYFPFRFFAFCNVVAIVQENDDE